MENVNLKHTKFYWVNGERVQFMAEIGFNTFFKVPAAKFIFPGGKTVEVSVQSFTGELQFSDELSFDVQYLNGNWAAPLRESI